MQWEHDIWSDRSRRQPKEKALISMNQIAIFMKTWPFPLLLSLVLLLPSCSLQKRTTQPGWHVEFAGESGRSKKFDSSEGNDDGMASLHPRSPSDQENPSRRTLQSESRIFWRNQMIAPQAMVGQPIHATRLTLSKNHVAKFPVETFLVAKSNKILRRPSEPTEMNPDAPKNVGFLRFLLFLIGLPLTFIGLISLLLIGLDGAFFLVAVLFLTPGIIALKWAFTPNSKWGKRKQQVSESPGEVNRSKTNDAMNDELNKAMDAKQKEAERIRKEAMLEAQNERRRVRGEKSQARKTKRQDFFQSPTAKIALGFGAMIAAYALLFW